MGWEAPFTDSIVMYIPKTTLIVVLWGHVIAGKEFEGWFI